MRCRLCLGPEPQEKEIDPAQYREPVDVLSQSTNQVVCFGLHRGETLDLGEEFITKQTFEISDKTQSVVEAHRRERVLGEHMQPFEKLVDLACFGQAIDQAIHCLGTPSAKQNDDNIARMLVSITGELVKHRTTYSFLTLQNNVIKLFSPRGNTYTVVRISEPNTVTGNEWIICLFCRGRHFPIERIVYFNWLNQLYATII